LNKERNVTQLRRVARTVRDTNIAAVIDTCTSSLERSIQADVALSTFIETNSSSMVMRGETESARNGNVNADPQQWRKGRRNNEKPSIRHALMMSGGVVTE
jgi:hypothetical protein